LFDLLHRLHEAADRPSLRKIRGEDGPSVSTISAILKRQSVPEMRTLERLLTAWRADHEAAEEAKKLLWQISDAQSDQRVAKHERTAAVEAAPLPEPP
jgi:hypothetical protein